LSDIRRELRREVRDAFGGVSSLLRGSREGKKGKLDTVSRAKTVKAVLEITGDDDDYKSALSDESN
jgi:hypothetical protein